MVYQYSCASLKTDANIAGKVCEELTKTVGLTAKNLVDASRPETAPLHSEFEWNNDIAAEKYREDQARYIIRHLVIIPDDGQDEPVRAYITIRQGFEESKPYDHIYEIMQEPVKRNSLLDMAIHELNAFKKKYKTLTELAGVFEAIEKIAV